MNNKAIAPLVSVLLLIVFAIALGILVMTWGNNYEESHLKHNLCEDTELGVPYSIEVCISEPILTVENIGLISIDGFKITLFQDNEVIQYDQKQNLGVGQISTINIETNNPYIHKIKVIPIVNKNLVCPKAGFLIDIKDC